MMKTECDNGKTERISPDALLKIVGTTPADNPEKYKNTHNWVSQLVGQQVKSLMDLREYLRSLGNSAELYGPFASAAFIAKWQEILLDVFVLRPIRTQARIAAKTGAEPDFFVEHNRRTEQKYATLIRHLCRCFMKDGKFDPEKALELTCSAEGKKLLEEYMDEFSWLEKSYFSAGLTRLKAMKELMISLLLLVTEQPLKEGEMPYAKVNEDGSFAMPFPAYLEGLRIRLENLYNEDAFDIVGFSERATRGKLGYSPYEVVPGSELHTLRLRHYSLPEGVTPNGKVLYMASPLINKPEIFDLDRGKSVVEGMLKEGYSVYLIDHGDPGPDEKDLGLDFYGKTVHDVYLNIIKKRHPGHEIYAMGYCMAGTLILPYLARRVEERMALGKTMDIRKVALMASPVKFDDGESGHGPMRKVIRAQYNLLLMQELFGDVNIPPQIIDIGMQEIQPGVQYYICSGFYGRAGFPGAIRDSAPFVYWLTHGTKFAAKAHREWLSNIFIGNQIYTGQYCLPSSLPDLDGKPVNMAMLREGGVAIFDYRGERDPIAPTGSCIASELWGQVGECVLDQKSGNICVTRGGLNRTIEKNVGHIFVVSKILLAEYLEIVNAFYRE